MTLQGKITTSHKILDTAVQLHKPSLVILSFSGGYDSMVSSHIAARWSKRHAHSTNVITISADTLISADGWRDFVTNTAKVLGLPRFAIHDTDHTEKWKSRILDAGFPYRKSQHRINFYYLKQVVFRRLIQEYKKHRTDRIMYVNGVRRAESADRQNRPEIAREGCGVFVNPILYWSDEDVQTYRLQHEMPDNPFYDSIGNSGDCLCNWHTQFTLEQLRQHGTAALQTIEPLHNQCREQFGYGYGEEPANGYFQGTPQMELPGFEDTPDLCASCRKPKPHSEALTDVMLQRMKW